MLFLIDTVGLKMTLPSHLGGERGKLFHGET